MKRKWTAKKSAGRKPSIEALRALATLAEAGSITETARRLDVSQPVISKKLQVFKSVEGCGAILLRPEDSNEFTEAGRAVLPAIRELVGRYDRIIRFLQGEVVSPQVVRIAAGSFAAEHYLPVAISRLKAIIEDCQIETQVCRGRDRIVGTARGAFDLAVVTHDRSQIRQILQDERLDASSLVISSLARHATCVLARRDSEAGRELLAVPEDQRIPLSRLTTWELIGPDRQSGLRRQLEQRLRGKSLYFVTEGGGWSAAKEYARQGLGVAIAPAATVRSADQETLVSRRLSPEFDVTDYLLHSRNEPRPFVQEAKRAIVAAVRSRQNASKRSSST